MTTPWDEIPACIRRDANNRAPFMDPREADPWNWNAPSPASNPPASPPNWVPPWQK